MDIETNDDNLKQLDGKVHSFGNSKWRGKLDDPLVFLDKLFTQIYVLCVKNLMVLLRNPLVILMTLSIPSILLVVFCHDQRHKSDEFDSINRQYSNNLNDLGLCASHHSRQGTGDCIRVVYTSDIEATSSDYILDNELIENTMKTFAARNALSLQTFDISRRS